LSRRAAQQAAGLGEHQQPDGAVGYKDELVSYRADDLRFLACERDEVSGGPALSGTEDTGLPSGRTWCSMRTNPRSRTKNASPHTVCGINRALTSAGERT